MQALIQVLPWLVTIVGTSAFWAVPRHPLGWGLAVCSQVFYIPFVLLTHEWGFLAHAVAYGSVFIRNFIYDERHPRNAARAAKNGAKVKVSV